MVAPTRGGNSHPVLSPFDVVPAADGWASVAAPSEVHWVQLCDVIGRDDLVNDPRTKTNTSRVHHHHVVDEAIVEWTSTRSKHQIVTELGGRVPVAPINNVQDIFDDPHVKARQMLSAVEHPGTSTPVTIVSSPIKLLGSPWLPPRRAPLLGEHKAEILAQFDIPPGVQK